MGDYDGIRQMKSVLVGGDGLWRPWCAYSVSYLLVREREYVSVDERLLDRMISRQSVCESRSAVCDRKIERFTSMRKEHTHHLFFISRF